MTKISHRITLACVAAAAVLPAAANDFPTSERVVYVQECMRNNPGNHYEMLNKCSCALDRLAEELKYDDYVTMSTMANALTIGGERGSEFRDNAPVAAEIKRFRELQARVQKSCMIAPPIK